MEPSQLTTLAETVRPPPSASTERSLFQNASPQRSLSHAKGNETVFVPYASQRPLLDAIGADLEAARAYARVDQQQYGEHGAYAVATLYHALYLDQARDHLADWNEWLAEHARLEEETFHRGETHASLAQYQLHTYLREMVMALHYARHWAMLSAAYHHSRAAAAAFEHITRAIQQIEQLSQDAGRAFLAASA